MIKKKSNRNDKKGLQKKKTQLLYIHTYFDFDERRD